MEQRAVFAIRASPTGPDGSGGPRRLIPPHHLGSSSTEENLLSVSTRSLAQVFEVNYVLQWRCHKWLSVGPADVFVHVNPNSCGTQQMVWGKGLEMNRGVVARKQNLPSLRHHLCRAGDTGVSVGLAPELDPRRMATERVSQSEPSVEPTNTN